MARHPFHTDSVRLSRDGHEFHEAWAARKALQLLHPTDNLVGIAVEGPSPADHSKASSETVEIADLVLYYGERPTFEHATTVKILQLKYSVIRSSAEFRCVDAKKTLEKFAAAYLDHKKNYGQRELQAKLQFELITNRPICHAFEEAIAGIAYGKTPTGKARTQAGQFKKASRLRGNDLAQFARMCRVTGSAGSLAHSNATLSRTIADWSGASDPLARARLGNLRDLVRDKAGTKGQHQNLITRIDILAVLELQDETDLLPCPASFPNIDTVIDREQLKEAAALIPALDKPLIVHAPGGLGKTVFIESLATALSQTHEVILFDCFGGGAYRDPKDARHLPRRGLVHIANTLACRGLCDPLLPTDGTNNEGLIGTFRRRLVQAANTLRQTGTKKGIVLFLDAIDNAAEHARDTSEPAFPGLLLKSIHYGGPISGVRLVVSCRSERIPLSRGDTECTEFHLKPFSLAETEIFLRARLKNVTESEIRVARARSGGNPRVLDHLIGKDRGVLDDSEVEHKVELDALITSRIDQALSDAVARGARKADTDAFLAGLSVLPPPVPPDEFAGALGIAPEAVESFAADLAPLLERTSHGLMFRDEPTETLIRNKYALDTGSLHRVATHLTDRQDTSAYAARALPKLLQRLDRGEDLFNLAFDERFPQSITSTVGKRRIRHDRLMAATLHAAKKRDNNHLVHLLVELSTISAVDQRGADYILDYPDLVIAAQDIDATRRLFETRTTWPGTRHARLAVAHTLSGELDDAYRHCVRAEEWIWHDRHDKRPNHRAEHGGPEQLDIAAIPFLLITQKKANRANGYMRGWKDRYAYEVAAHVFHLLEQARVTMPRLKDHLREYLASQSNDIGVIASGLSFLEHSSGQRRHLIKKLSKACARTKSVEYADTFHRRNRQTLSDGLLKSAASALSLGLNDEASTICRLVPSQDPTSWSFRDDFLPQEVFPFAVATAIISASRKAELKESDVLPKELKSISSDISSDRDQAAFKKELSKRLDAHFQANKGRAPQGLTSMSYEQKTQGDRFIATMLSPWLALLRALSAVLAARINRCDKVFLTLLDAWKEAKDSRDSFGRAYQGSRFFERLGCQLVIFTLWVRSDLKTSTVAAFLERSHSQHSLDVRTAIEVVGILARRPHLNALAGEEAVKARSMIEAENDVATRASLYAQLGRAILPASTPEAVTYFKAGLEQMDAIGSGDYQFTNELLLFASHLKGPELIEQDFHTLTNICELNMSDEEEKFPWISFGKALSRVSGCNGLAKLSRWDDRSKVSVDYTFLPYLVALIEDDKIQPEDALALLKLSLPAEWYACDSSTLATAMAAHPYPNHKELFSELIQQFQSNNRGISQVSAVKGLAPISEQVLGRSSEVTEYLCAANVSLPKLLDETNANQNSHWPSETSRSRKAKKQEATDRATLDKLAASINPLDELSMGKAIDRLNDMHQIHSMKEPFFDGLHRKVTFSDRPKYIGLIAGLENLDIYPKLTELEKCRHAWGQSSAALPELYKTIGPLLVQRHLDDFISFDHLSVSDVKRVSELSEVPIPTLALELIQLLTSSDHNVPASVWLGLASIIVQHSSDGEGQSALSRLLNSNSAKLASEVADGQWTSGLYPSGDPKDIIAGLVWRKLGSPRTAERWRAAHSVRCLARFERWGVIDSLVGRIESKAAHPYQAPELEFYYLHAQLWLLIALARIAIDHPQSIAKYKDRLSQIAADDKSPHVLMRHFAARAILSCAEGGSLTLSAKVEERYRKINDSPFPRSPEKLKQGMPRSWFGSRPKDAPAPKTEFHWDYDFEKSDIHSLSAVFGKPDWEVQDLMADAIQQHDANITSMYANGGREGAHGSPFHGMTSKYHTYGGQLGWHALFIAAGRMLSESPVTSDWYPDEPWAEWLSRNLLTRQDGLWLADGMDTPPLNTQINLLEKSEERLAITGSKAKILSLLGIPADFSFPQAIVVEGNWSSLDNIAVSISSALVSPSRSKALARALIQEEPFFVWLPTQGGYEDGDNFMKKAKHYVPWITCPSAESKLDGDDPLGSSCAMRRPLFSRDIVSAFATRTDDSFGRVLRTSGSDGRPVAHSYAWEHKNRYDDESSTSGVSLLCSRELLKDILTTRCEHLLILVRIQRYEKGIGTGESKFSHSVGIVRIKETLDFEWLKGRMNYTHEMKH